MLYQLMSYRSRRRLTGCTRVGFESIKPRGSCTTVTDGLRTAVKKVGGGSGGDAEEKVNGRDMTEKHQAANA
jgi:hypothetical protein